MPLEYILGAIVVLGFLSIKVLYQYERGVVFTLGQFDGVRNPGLTFVIPILQELRKVDMRIVTEDIPKQEVITKDNIPALVNTVCYFRVEKPEDAIIKIENYREAVAEYTQAAVRDVVGNSELDFILTEREKIAENIKKIVDEETGEWGVDIISVKIQEIELPAEMKRAMAKQAEAERGRRARITVSQGELGAADNLRKAADKLAGSEGALHLRTLQTIGEIAADPSEKIVMLIPAEILGALKKYIEKK